MKTPVRGEERLQMMSDEELRRARQELGNKPRSQWTRSDEEYAREVSLEQQRREIAREMRQRDEEALVRARAQAVVSDNVITINGDDLRQLSGGRLDALHRRLGEAFFVTVVEFMAEEGGKR